MASFVTFPGYMFVLSVVFAVYSAITLRYWESALWAAGACLWWRMIWEDYDREKRRNDGSR